jgi:Mg2+/Co2+ transporter CorB
MSMTPRCRACARKPTARSWLTVLGAIRDLNRALDWSLPDDEATTVAGLVIHESQTIPEEKQAFTFHGKRFIVMKRDRNRITRLRIRPMDKS